jgi:hypothetical protein
VPESEFVELVADIFDCGVGERDHADSSSLSGDDVGDKVQDGLGLTGVRGPLDDRDGAGEAQVNRFPLADVAAEREDRGRGQFSGRDRCTGQVATQHAVGVDEVQPAVRTLQRIVVGKTRHDVAPVTQHLGCGRSLHGAHDDANLRRRIGVVLLLPFLSAGEDPPPVADRAREDPNFGAYSQMAPHTSTFAPGGSGTRAGLRRIRTRCGPYRYARPLR